MGAIMCTEKRRMPDILTTDMNLWDIIFKLGHYQTRRNKIQLDFNATDSWLHLSWPQLKSQISAQNITVFLQTVRLLNSSPTRYHKIRIVVTWLFYSLFCIVFVTVGIITGYLLCCLVLLIYCGSEVLSRKWISMLGKIKHCLLILLGMSLKQVKNNKYEGTDYLRRLNRWSNQPGTAMVHSSHRKVSLGSDGMPTPAMLAALTWNWYFLFSFRSDTWRQRGTKTELCSALPVGL